MRYRLLGRTGIKVSELGFGCGSVGGLIIRGDHKEVVQAVARAIEVGVNYFDTAAIYGQGQSETNLGAVLAELRADVLVGTKVRLTPSDLENIGNGVRASLEASLKRLKRDYVDLFQLHNSISARRDPARDSLTVPDVRAALDTFQSLQEEGKIRFWGITGLGETDAVHAAVRSLDAHTIQACYNLLNPTGGMQAPPGFPFQDFGQLIDRAAERGMGVIAIRVLAAGALSGTMDRHPLADGSFGTLATGRDYKDDVNRSAMFGFLVREGYTSSLVEAAFRFAISRPEVSTALIGFSSLGQLEEAAAYAARGPLPQEALDRIADAVAGHAPKPGRSD